MKHSAELTADEQTAILADRYSLRADAYDELWSPVIRPSGESLLRHLPLSGTANIIDVGTGAGALLPLIQRAAQGAKVLGVDRSEGMLRLAREKHSGPLALMDVQQLALPANQFEAAIVAFVLFHLPHPDRCLSEVNRVLKPGGTVGTITWGPEDFPPVNTIWDQELEAAGAQVIELPATDNRSCCDSQDKIRALLKQAGFLSIKAWRESIEYRWRPEDHFDYQVRSSSRMRLQSLSADDREACLRRIRDRISGADHDAYVYRGEVVMAMALKQSATGEVGSGEERR